MIYPVILSGGSGSRLWPLSRQKSPKQFIDLVGQHNLLQDTCRRLSSIEGVQKPIVVSNEDHRFQVAESLRAIDLQDSAIILEPVSRNTAPAIALGALEISQVDEDAIILVLAADHHFRDIQPLSQSIEKGLPFAQKNWLVTFGVKPTAPQTGYGYIQQGNMVADGVFEVNAFVEKPTADKAKQYMDSGTFHWNSGIFMMKASTYLENLKIFDKTSYDACLAAYEKRCRDLDFIRVNQKAFSQAISESVDYAIMEKSKEVVVVPFHHSGWSDIGSWGALFELEDKDADDNIIQGDVVSYDVENCYLRSHDRLLAAVGIQDLIVVETADAIMVSHKDKTQEVKQIVKQLEQSNRKELIEHKRVYTLWGYREMLVEGDRFMVQKLYFACDKASSIQMHYHKSKHITVLSGTAEVMVKGEVILLPENKSMMIDIGTKHQIRNNGKIPLRLMEVQAGSYLHEDDIIRFESE